MSIKLSIKNQVKRIMFFDMRRYLNHKKLSQKQPEGFRYYLSIALIIKNEAEYVPEWIEYHLLQGVEKFYIYDNNSTDNLKEVLTSYIEQGIVDYIPFPKEHQQIVMCNDAIKRSEKEAYWLAIIDTDEFIVPLKNENLAQTLKEYESYPGLEVNWLLYGDSGHKTKTDGLVLERFIQHALPEEKRNRHVKSIYNPRKVAYVCTPHDAIYFDKAKSVNTDKKENSVPFLEREGCFDKLIINHYFTRSEEEYLSRRESGPATQGAVLYGTMEMYDLQNKNDITEIRMEKYIPIIKLRLIGKEK